MLASGAYSQYAARHELYLHPLGTVIFCTLGRESYDNILEIVYSGFNILVPLLT